MANAKKDSQTSRNMMGPVVMGIAGAAIGASAVALSNKKIRKQIGKVLEDAVDQGKEAFGEVQDRIYVKVRQLGKRAKNAIDKEKARSSRRIASHSMQ